MEKRLNVENDFLVGHVGRFSKEKNHKFIVEVFSKLIQIIPSAKLLLIGEGGLKPEIEKLVIEKGLSDKVIFYGISHEIPKLMLAMDAFIFPSHYEGWAIAAVEAQCSGLPLFCSKGIPEATRLTPVSIMWTAQIQRIGHVQSQAVKVLKEKTMLMK